MFFSPNLFAVVAIQEKKKKKLFSINSAKIF